MIHIINNIDTNHLNVNGILFPLYKPHNRGNLTA
jgi:hypothetical protein